MEIRLHAHDLEVYQTFLHLPQDAWTTVHSDVLSFAVLNFSAHFNINKPIFDICLIQPQKQSTWLRAIDLILCEKMRVRFGTAVFFFFVQDLIFRQYHTHNIQDDLVPVV